MRTTQRALRVGCGAVLAVALLVPPLSADASSAGFGRDASARGAEGRFRTAVPFAWTPIRTTADPAPTSPPVPTATPTATPAATPTPGDPPTATPTVIPTPGDPPTATPTATPTFDGNEPGEPATVPSDRSGLPWASGVYARGSKPAISEAFGKWRGRPLDVVVDWPARASWSDIVAPGWLYRAWAGTPYTKVFGVAPLPERDPSATLAGCARGDYEDKWRQFGQNIVAAGLDEETIIRLGWEFNGNWYKWQAKDPAQFAACWRQIVSTVETVAPALRWDWTVNRGRGQSVADARLAYPGDDYVDIVGVDSYDIWPAANTEAGWQQHYAGEYGLKFWADFAAQHDKPLSVPEWGVYPGTAHFGHNGGDNPFYVSKMFAFFRSQGDALAYESYFNDNAPYYAGSLFAPSQARAAAERYRRELAGS